MEPTDAPLGRRDRKRRDTRAALAEAALELFEENGFAATTIEEITERADVSRRTFFRYFTNKESVLLPDPAEHSQALADALAAQDLPLTMSKILQAFIASSAVVGADHELRRRRASVVAANHLDMGATSWQMFAAIRETITATLAARTGLPVTDERLDLAASFGLYAMSVAYVRWSELPEAVDFDDLLAGQLTVIRGLLNDEIELGGP